MAYKLIPLRLPPGISRNGTHYESKGRWWDGNLVRWFNGVMRPIGGWIQGAGDNTLTGKARAGRAWRLNNGSRRAVFATHSKVYAWDGGTLADITPPAYTSGRQDSILGFGYGTFTYGFDTYGTQRTTGASIGATAWSLDLWGQNLIGVADHENIIYEWDGQLTSDLTAVTNAPSADAVFVTMERILVALGSGGDPRKVSWSDAEDNTDWTPVVTNQAGYFFLPTNGPLMSGTRVAGGQNLILSTSDAFVMSYIGPPFIYGFDKVGSDCGVVGRLAHVAFDGRVAWMGRRNFWLYDGSVKQLPSEVADYVFDRLNQEQVEKVHTAHVPRYSEIWWFYPSGTNLEPDSYVTWNYREGHWSIGTLDRTCWVSATGVFSYPFAVASDGKVYEHENGWTADGSTREVYAQAGPVEIGQGERTAWVNQIIADEDTEGEVQLRLYTRFTPNEAAVTHGPFSISDGYADCRLQGRQVSLRVEEATAATDDWRWGTPRLRVEPGSGR
jgi:hypothetical protein